MSTRQERSLDEERLTDLTQRVVADMGAILTAGAVLLGDQLGLYRALAAGPLCPMALAGRTGTAPRYVEEWLRGQAASGYVGYDATTGEYFLTPEQAHVLTDPAALPFAPGAFELALGAVRGEPALAQAFLTGEGISWSGHDSRVFDGWTRLQRSLYSSQLVGSWLPAVPGVARALRRGARVADVECGHALTTILMAQAFPRSRFFGFDHHASSVAIGQEQVAEAGLNSRVSIATACAHEFPGGPYDLITTFEALHDMGDPGGMTRHIAEQLAPDGTWLIVEPAAGGSVLANLTPIGRFYYGLSLFLCVPNALSQEGGYSLGAQAGAEPVRRLAVSAGLTSFTEVARTPFTAVYAARREGAGSRGSR